jgi:hypothetical protein
VVSRVIEITGARCADLLRLIDSGAAAVPDLTSIAGINLNEGFALPSTTPPIAFRPPNTLPIRRSDEVVGRV